MEQKPVLSNQDIATILAVSIGFDLVQSVFDFIPGVGWVINVIVDVFAWMAFYFLLKEKGIDFDSFAKIAALNAGFVLNLFPFVSTFAWTLDMLVIISIVRSEGKAKRVIEILESHKRIPPKE